MHYLQETPTKQAYITWEGKKNGILLTAYDWIGC